MREMEEAEARKTISAERSKEDLGVVFAGSFLRDLSLNWISSDDGDVIDDFEIEQKKKTALEMLDEAKKGKELKPVDHSSIEYLPFRKNLFIVPRALGKLNDEQIKAKRDDLQIKVRGKGNGFIWRPTRWYLERLSSSRWELGTVRSLW